MMTERKQIYIVVSIVVLGGLLLSLLAGAVAGGIAGYLVGRQQARAAVEAEIESALSSLRKEGMLLQEPRPQPETPMPFVSPPGLLRQGAALLLEVTPDSPADEAGLQPGDMILSVDDEDLTPEQDLAQLIGQFQPGDTVALRVLRMGEERTVDVTLGRHPDDPDRSYLGITYRTIATLP